MEQSKHKNMQYLVIGACGLGVVAVFGVLIMVSNSAGKTSIIPGAKESEVSVDMISKRSSGASPEMDWVVQSRDRLKGLEAKMEKLGKDKESSEREYQKQLNAVSKGYEEMIGTQAERIKQLELRLGNGDAEQSTVTTQNTAPTKSQKPKYGATQSQNRNGSEQAEFVSNNGKRKIVLKENEPKPEKVALNRSFSKRFTLKAPADTRKANVKRYQLGSYLPAGSYAPALVISGVDASVGVESQAAPKPVLLRITGYATTAGFGSTKGARINLKGCLVSGAATGDLSAERVYVRLTQMTCQNADSSVFETKVAGHMVSSGKAGLRGEVVSREGPSVRSAAIAGVLEGFASGVSSASGSLTGGLTTDTGGNPDVAKVLQSAGASTAAGGIGGAASTLADYYIKRAEQYQPIISMYAGSKVEVVFMEGVHLQ